MNGLEDAEGEDTPDHTGNFKRQLLGGIEAVDAISDCRLQRIGQREILKIHEARMHPAFLVVYHQNARITESIGKLFRKERMPFRFFADEAADHRRNRFDSQALADQCLHVVEHHRFQFQQTCTRRFEDLLELQWIWLRQRAGIQCEEERPHFLLHIHQQSPRGGIKPVQIFHHDQERRLAGFERQQAR